MRPLSLLILLCLLIISLQGYAQLRSVTNQVDSSMAAQYLEGITLTIPKQTTSNIDSGIQLLYYHQFSCKGNYIKGEFVPFLQPADVIAEPVKKVQVNEHKIKFLTIHGNISYDFYYRSKIDTPISQQDFQQYTERVYVDVLLKEKLPIKVGFVLRQSNSPFFRDFNDVNFRFDRFAYGRNLKQDLLNRLTAQLPKRPDLQSAETALKVEKQQLLDLKNWLDNPATLQKLIEEKEKQYHRKLLTAKKEIDSNNIETGNIDFRKKAEKKFPVNDNIFEEYKTKSDSVAVGYSKKIKEEQDSIFGKFEAFYDSKKKKSDSLQKDIKLLQSKSDSLKAVVQKDIIRGGQEIGKVSSEQSLKKVAADHGISIDSVNKFQKRLLAVKSFSLGRSILDYTELTAQNITITGINVEYNPSWYAAIAAGKIDYRFRDFFNKNTKNNGQYLLLGRIGIGDRERKALIFTVFQGRKSQSQFAIADSVSNHVSVLGYSLEAIYKKNENTTISAELAKSTKPLAGAVENSKQLNALWKFSDNTNLGINFKAQTVIPETNTKLSGFYRKTGENFQSFSMFSYNTDQTAWLARADQFFYKNRVSVTGMLRRNDFTNPFTDKTYKTSTVFKTVLLNIRIPKYPSLSIGYYPGTQLYVVNKELIRENAYYILNGSLVYGYRFKGISMNSSVVYNQYYNKATDSGFVLYKGVNYYLSHTVFLRKLQLQGSYAYTRQPELKYYTLEGSGEYAFKNYFKIGAGVKYNQMRSGVMYWGERILLTADFKQLGGLQLQYEKSYLPNLNQTLYPVEIGRVSWYKFF